MAANFLPYGINMKQWKMEDQCPRCHQPGENKPHLNKCQDPSAIEMWTVALEKLDDWLKLHNMAPQLQQELIAGLHRWQQDLPPQQNVANASKAATEQELLGWQNMLKGVISTKWQEEQKRFVKHIS